MRWKFLAGVLFSIFLAGCIQHDTEDAPGTLENLRGDFQFSISPGTEVASCLIRFRKTQSGAGVSLPAAELLLNGKLLKPDSTEMNGVFYEAQIPVAEFFREQVIQIRQGEKTYTEKFVPTRFVVSSGLPVTTPSKDMVLSVNGVEEGQELLVTLVDTSFDNNDFQRRLEVNDQKIMIPGSALDSLSSGPVSAEVHYELRIPTRKLPLKRGFISLKQMVAGEFLLEN
jgi:hypothetical protein